MKWPWTRKQTLAQYFGKNASTSSKRQIAHIIIDVQREFCDPAYFSKTEQKYLGSPETRKIAARIAHRTPHFRQTGIQTGFVYFWEGKKGFESSLGGPYFVEKKDGDFTVGKGGNSAMTCGRLREVLDDNGIKNLLISGFNTTACIHDTAVDAVKYGFKTIVLSDCIGDCRESGQDIAFFMKKMIHNGVYLESSQNVLDFLGD